MLDKSSALDAQGGKLSLEACNVTSTTGTGVASEGGSLEISNSRIHDCQGHGLAVFADLEVCKSSTKGCLDRSLGQCPSGCHLSILIFSHGELCHLLIGAEIAGMIIPATVCCMASENMLHSKAILCCTNSTQRADVYPTEECGITVMMLLILECCGHLLVY